MKKCFICGKPIYRGQRYYSVWGQKFVCNCDNCYESYFWDDMAARYRINPWHEYFVAQGKLYQIGSDDDEPRGFGGQHYKIKFFDGTVRETNSLWLIGEVPMIRKCVLRDNASFVTEGE